MRACVLVNLCTDAIARNCTGLRCSCRKKPSEYIIKSRSTKMCNNNIIYYVFIYIINKNGRARASHRLSVESHGHD